MLSTAVTVTVKVLLPRPFRRSVVVEDAAWLIVPLTDAPAAATPGGSPATVTATVSPSGSFTPTAKETATNSSLLRSVRLTVGGRLAGGGGWTGTDGVPGCFPG